MDRYSYMVGYVLYHCIHHLPQNKNRQKFGWIKTFFEYSSTKENIFVIVVLW